MEGKFSLAKQTRHTSHIVTLLPQGVLTDDLLERKLAGIWKGVLWGVFFYATNVGSMDGIIDQISHRVYH